jgi:hypothetical protein
MGVLSTYAFSFMSKYLQQYCGPKPMTRVDINDSNQYSNSSLSLFMGALAMGKPFIRFDTTS